MDTEIFTQSCQAKQNPAEKVLLHRCRPQKKAASLHIVSTLEGLTSGNTLLSFTSFLDMSLLHCIASTSRNQLSNGIESCICRNRIYGARTFAVTALSNNSRGNRKIPIQQLRDEAIPSNLIRIVQSDESGGGLGPIRQKNSVLYELDRSKYWLIQGGSFCYIYDRPNSDNDASMFAVDVQALSPSEASLLGWARASSVGVCKVIQKKEAFDKAKERTALQKAKRKANHVEQKELQLTWGVTLNDLTHKLKRAQLTLEGGGRLSLNVSAPKDSHVPSRPEREMFLEMCREQLGQKDGKLAVWKPEVWSGSSTALFLRGVKDKDKDTQQMAARNSLA